MRFYIAFLGLFFFFGHTLRAMQRTEAVQTFSQQLIDKESSSPASDFPIQLSKDILVIPQVGQKIRSINDLQLISSSLNKAVQKNDQHAAQLIYKSFLLNLFYQANSQQDVFILPGVNISSIAIGIAQPLRNNMQDLFIQTIQDLLQILAPIRNLSYSAKRLLDELHGVIQLQQNENKLTHNCSTQFVGGGKSSKPSSLAAVTYFNNAQHMISRNSCRNQSDGANVIIQQVRVQDQGAELTCGYHAVKNGCALVGLVHGRDSGILLQNPAAFEFCGDRKNWGSTRRLIIEQRRKKQAIDELISLIINPHPIAAKNENEDQLRTVYTTNLKRFLDGKIDEYIKDPKNNRVNADEIRHQLSALQDLTQSLELINLARMPEAYERYVNIPVNPLNIALKNDPLYGEKLNSAEIEFIKMSIQRCGGPSGQNLFQALGDIPLQIIESTEPQKPEIQGKKVDHPLSILEVTAHLRQALANKSCAGHGVYAFILGSAAQTKGAEGHWVALIVEIANGERRYTIADSVNELQIFNGPAASVIKFVEGEQFELVPSATYLRNITETLKICLEHWEANPADLSAQMALDDVVLRFEQTPNVDYQQFGGAPAFYARIANLKRDHNPTGNSRVSDENDTPNKISIPSAAAEAIVGLPDYLLKFSEKFAKLSPEQRDDTLEMLQMIHSKRKDAHQSKAIESIPKSEVALKDASIMNCCTENKNDQKLTQPTSTNPKIGASQSEQTKTDSVSEKRECHWCMPTVHPYFESVEEADHDQDEEEKPNKQKEAEPQKKRSLYQGYRMASGEIQNAGATVQSIGVLIAGGYLLVQLARKVLSHTETGNNA